MNIDPKIWGPSSWKFMHYITIGYPENPSQEVKSSTYNFFTSLKNILPCEKCRYNFGYHLNNRPLTNEILSSRNKLINWLIDIHNDVNIATGKSTLTYDQALTTYTNSSENESIFSSLITGICNMDGRILTVIITIILIIIIIIVIKTRCFVQ